MTLEHDRADDAAADADAEDFGRSLVDDRLAACVNLLLMMESVIGGKGASRRNPSVRSRSSTARSRVEALWERARDAPLRSARNSW